MKNIIEKPDMIARQVADRQARLQAEGDSVDGEVATAYKELQDLDIQRAFCQRRAAKVKAGLDYVYWLLSDFRTN